MKFAHLPQAGGLYDQHPQLLREWEYIMAEEAKYQEKKRKDEERKRSANSGKPYPRAPKPRRR